MAVIVSEHQSLGIKKSEFSQFNPYERTIELADGFLLNPNAAEKDKKYFFTWEKQKDSGKYCYNASYIIGAQRIGSDELIIKPKLSDIDFMKMFSVCFNSGIETESFSKIYGINFDEKPIKTDVDFVTSLTPLLIVHFIKLITSIVNRGLKTDYIHKDENIRKIKGKINISKHEQKNVMTKRYDYVYCKYSERSVNTPENRLFKKALLFCRQFIFKMKENDSFSVINQKLNLCLSHFDFVDENIELWEIKNTKSNKLYKDYDEAIKIAKLILRRFDYSISNIKLENKETPVFWIDMPLLYEHYALGILKSKYRDDIVYQAHGHAGYPDFICKSERLILDTKYKDISVHSFDWENIQQLSGYSRDNTIRKKYFKLEDTDDSLIKCVLIYPDKEIDEESQQYAKIPVYKGKKKITDLLNRDSKSKFYKEFYRICIPLPRIII